MSLVATTSGVDSDGVAFARRLVDDAPTRQVDGDPATIGDVLTNLDAQLLVIPPAQAERLVDEAPCIVAVVPPDAPRPARIATVGVVWDGSVAAAHARRWAANLARRTGASLELMAPEQAAGAAHPDVTVVGCAGSDRGGFAAQIAVRAPGPVVVVPLDVPVPAAP